MTRGFVGSAVADFYADVRPGIRMTRAHGVQPRFALTRSKEHDVQPARMGCNLCRPLLGRTVEPVTCASGNDPIRS